MGIFNKQTKSVEKHGPFPIQYTVEHYRVRTWYLDKDGVTREHVTAEAMQSNYPKELGAGDLVIRSGEMGNEHLLIIPRHRIVAIECERIFDGEAYAILRGELSS